MRSIAELFKGRDDVHGYYGLLETKPSDRGKRTGQAATKRQPVTEELWQQHLTGKQRLGIVPVCKNSKVWWFCIDVDHYQDPTLLEKLATKISETGLPLVMTRSKSGGPHLWCFLSEQLDAAVARTIAHVWAKRLDLPEGHVDIFPAQGNVMDVGNWMNMPYFGDQCHGAGEDGKQNQTLAEFEEYANTRLTDPNDIKSDKKEAQKATSKRTKRGTGKGSQLPPCIDHFLEDGINEGGRNNVITHFGVVYKNAYPDDWEEKVREVNSEHCDPPLPRDDMRNITRSVKTRELGYMCDKVKEAGGICDIVACKKRTFGVGQGSAIDEDGEVDLEQFPLTSITKIDGEKPMMRVTSKLNVTFMLTPTELLNHMKFRDAFYTHTLIALPRMKDDEWGEMLNAFREKVNTQAAAPDTQMGERVISQFRLFAARSNTDTLELALQRGLPYYSNRTITFRGDDFMQLIDRSLKLERERCWAYMDGHGCKMVDHGKEKLWEYTVPESVELWFNPYEGEQA